MRDRRPAENADAWLNRLVADYENIRISYTVGGKGDDSKNESERSSEIYH